MTTIVDVYNVIVSLLAGAGLLYLLYSGRYAVWYRRFYLLVTFGLLLSVVGGPLVFVVSESLRHLIHGIATLFVAVGLYELLRRRVTAADDWRVALLEE